jgi:hypothetical protein
MEGTPVSEFYVTFGQRYRREAHPRMAEVHPDGWVTIEADTYRVARSATGVLFGTEWCWLYEAHPGAHYFPRGELARFDAARVLA